MSTIMHSHEYLTQLEEKKARLGHLLNEFGNHELVVIPSKETGYRMRLTVKQRRSIGLIVLLQHRKPLMRQWTY